MTIREANWCEDCQEECRGHARLCTQCGSTLMVRPRPTTTRNPASFRAMPDLDAFLPMGLSTSGLVAAEVLSDLRRQVRATTVLAQQAIDNNNNNNNNQDGWQAIPAAWLDPQNSGGGKTPTKQEVLNQLPREVLKENSASFFRVLVKLHDSNTTYEGITGELGPLPTLHEPNEIHVEAPLWIPATRTQRTGKQPLQGFPESSPFIVVLERGDGISFFQKAYAAEQQGAVAVLILNDKTEPWPYVMKDSRTRTEKDNQGEVSIPTIMLSQKDGRALLQQCSSSSSSTTTITTSTTTVALTISHNPHDNATCVVCRDALQLGQTTLTLTNYCGHGFHESCALQWLQHHNTCPYCRRSLPTEEPTQEQERLRQLTGTHHNNSTGNGDAFYS